MDVLVNQLSYDCKGSLFSMSVPIISKFLFNVSIPDDIHVLLISFFMLSQTSCVGDDGCRLQGPKPCWSFYFVTPGMDGVRYDTTRISCRNVPSDTAYVRQPCCTPAAIEQWLRFLFLPGPLWMLSIWSTRHVRV